ncbi:MAG: glucosamine-6-phosphate deaminase, partial [Bacteriovoracaceae bacterium]
MEIKVFDSASLAAQFAAKEMALLLGQKSQANLGVATGRTMDAVYHHLGDIHKKEGFSCSKARTFALDEYIGLAPNDENSYRNYLDFHLFRPLGFSQENTRLPNVHHSDLDLAGFEYETQIKKAGGIDLQMLGIGLNGHIGLNEPGSAQDSRTRVVALSQKTRDSNKALFHEKEVPLTAMTMGIGTILEAKRIILLATGRTKAEIFQKFVNG